MTEHTSVKEYLDSCEFTSWTCHICGSVYSPNVVKCPKCSKNENEEPIKKQLLTEG